MTINIKAIAAKAGVSVATVSRTLNHPEKVHPATREKILALIKDLGYAPNPFAQGLSTGKTKLIALVVPTLNNSFFGQLAEGCQRYLVTQGYNLVIFSSQEYKDKELSIITSMDQRRFEGLIVSGSGFSPQNYQEILNKIEIPYVLVENLPELTNVNSVYIDDVAGACLATQHLIKLGHKRLGIIAGDKQMFTTSRRLQAVKRTMKQHRISLNELQVTYGQYSYLESGAAALKKLMTSPTPPTAVFAFNDILALGALKAALESGLRIPDDLAIIGFDDIPMSAYYTPALSTVCSPSLELGQEAARILLEQSESNYGSVQKVLLPVKLILRETC